MDKNLSFFSKRNTVTLVLQNGSPVIRKRFSDPDSMKNEAARYHDLSTTTLKIPLLLSQSDDSLYVSYLPGPTALELLEETERSGSLNAKLWRQLAQWCCRFYQETGYCLCDPNLRNFILHQDHWYGIDFEACRYGDPQIDFARLVAFVLLYDPKESPTKQAIAQILTDTFCAETATDPKMFHTQVGLEIDALILRRAKKDLPI